MNSRKIIWSGFVGFLTLGLPSAAGIARADAPAGGTVEFNRDVRPILSNNCFTCHGPDRNLRKAKLRLDLPEEAFAERDGTRAIVPGKPADSEVYRRLTTDNVQERMPPHKLNKVLSKDQIETVRRWIEQGAKYQGHWAYLPPQRHEPPEVKNISWVRNSIDRFVLARLEKEGLQPSPETDRRTLIRRLSLDLTGLPPTPADVDAFLADNAPEAYGRLVDRLLRSPHFGERMAIYWLDVVRFADTSGYHSDNHRDLHLYRDYVIQAFNQNKRFDQFTLEQLAGDLMPGATDEQRIASGYNRLLQTTEEGGAQAKEYAAKYQSDRVRNTATIWLGTTLGCCECHSHKFDPFTSKDFYSFGAFFADLQERSVGRQEQTAFPTPQQALELKLVEFGIATVKTFLNREDSDLDAAQAKWEHGLKADSKGGAKLPKEVAAILKVEHGKRNASEQQSLAAHYREHVSPELRKEQQKLATLQRQKEELKNAIPTTLVSVAGAPRTVKMLPRGNWLDESGEVVQPAVPASLPQPDVKGRRATRLDLARWMVAPENPLTARVFVNRLWRLMYGQGIVKTQEDFGSQGAWPTHPELLDWLALEFRDSGWDVQHMIRLMAASSTYRQTSKASEPLKHRDPYNLLLARQARFRLDAELVRDNALAVSGLLSRKIGGPSVKPYQPAGYWAFLNFPTRDWKADHGPDQYRRGLYTYWQRTFLHPSLLAFDAPTREECTVERPRSNIPQQALVLLNDPTYVEAARALAERVVRDGGSGVEERIHFAYRQVLARKAEPIEVETLTALHGRHLQQYQADSKAAEALLHVGDRPTPADLPAPELAAWTSVARVLLNLHETITRE